MPSRKHLQIQPIIINASSDSYVKTVNLATGILMKNCCKVNLETGPSIVIGQENKEPSKTGISRITTILGVNKQTKKSHPP